MVEVWLPYGKTEVCARIPARNFLGAIEVREKPGVSSPRAEIERTLKEPLGTKPLGETVKRGNKVAIVVGDETSPAPSFMMVPPILDELSLAGVRDDDVTVIFACGANRPVEPGEMEKLVGGEVLKRVATVSHNPGSEDQAYLGKTSLGTEVYVNRSFAEADVRILTGAVALHPFAGYGGGREGVLPGVSGARTVQSTRRRCLDPGAEVGVLEGNPVHQDMVEAAKLARVDFALNVVTNSRREVVGAFAGDLEQVFREGVKLVDEMYKVSVERRAEIVVVSPGGDPLDDSLCHAVQGVDHALNAVKKGGVVVLVAECSGGYGPEVFYDWTAKFKGLKDMERELKRRFASEGHTTYRLMRALQKVRIILVSVMPDYYAVNTFNLRTARAVNDALREAFDLAGKKAKVWTMPQGSFTLPTVQASK